MPTHIEIINEAMADTDYSIGYVDGSGENQMALKPTYETLDKILGVIISDIEILAGDQIGPSDASWQDVAGTLSTNMKVYAKLLDQARQGEGMIIFPSLNDHIE